MLMEGGGAPFCILLPLVSQADLLFAALYLGKHRICCLEGALHFVLFFSGWQTRQTPQAASLCPGNSSEAHGLKAIKLNYSKPAAIEATESGRIPQQFAFLGGKLNLRDTFCIQPTASWEMACDYSCRLQQPKLKAQDILCSWQPLLTKRCVKTGS